MYISKAETVANADRNELTKDSYTRLTTRLNFDLGHQISGVEFIIVYKYKKLCQSFYVLTSPSLSSCLSFYYFDFISTQFKKSYKPFLLVRYTHEEKHITG